MDVGARCGWRRQRHQVHLLILTTPIAGAFLDRFMSLFTSPKHVEPQVSLVKTAALSVASQEVVAHSANAQQTVQQASCRSGDSTGAHRCSANCHGSCLPEQKLLKGFSPRNHHFLFKPEPLAFQSIPPEHHTTCLFV
ncbi:hypothetical protein QBC38DRAFT_16637 [Podospora fimiseda]|uniref:Uncharacterized protein n=1 Tax=Podospora fimiseda TaxID=252190 RepID=A0AAN7BJJ0_9PEZI|nr:hypothetical protein QBC38DRAFT_16637 [Podospora fimiseda]